MIVSNTKSNRDIAYVAATMAIEGMPLSHKEIDDLMRAANGETSTEQLRKELLEHIRNETLEEHARR